jgi:ABC-2 type transport system permease protein
MGPPRYFGDTDGAFAISVFAFGSLIFLVGGVAIWSYLVDSLYGERRDRSILFWKSMPVSDTKTVLSKLAVGLLAAPIIMFAMVVVTHFICSLLLLARPPGGFPIEQYWNIATALKAYGWLGLVMLVNALWLAPAAAYAMLGSVISRKSPWLVLLLPPLILSIGEQLLFGSGRVTRFVLARFAPRLDLERAISSPSLWIGVVLAAVLIAAVIHLRRWRDDA